MARKTDPEIRKVLLRASRPPDPLPDRTVRTWRPPCGPDRPLHMDAGKGLPRTARRVRIHGDTPPGFCPGLSGNGMFRIWSAYGAPGQGNSSSYPARNRQVSEMLSTLGFIAVFAIFGAWARYGQTLLVQSFLGRDFPWATLSVNVLGCFIMGFLFFLTLDRLTLSPALRTGILAGGLGAYTTFSTFSLETVNLLENGEMLKGALYMCASLFLCVLAAFAGATLSRIL